MDDRLNVFQALARRMSWLGRRQAVLSQNIANADTPGYRPLDLKALDMRAGPFARLVAGKLAPVRPVVRPVATHAAHMSGPGGGAKRLETESQRDTFEVKPSGNAVVLEEQLIKVADTQMNHQAMSNLYRKHLRLFQIAIGGGGS